MNNRPFILRPTLRGMSAPTLLAARAGVQRNLALAEGESTRPAPLAVSGEPTGTARRAEYYELDQRVLLIGNARVWQEDNVVSGETITMYLSQDRSVVEGGKQERVKAVFYPKESASGAPQPSKPAATACSN